MLDLFGQIWRQRPLAEVLVARDLKARYRGTLLGFFWSFANPLLTMSIYVLVFRVYMRIDIENYPAFVLCGLLPWMAFSAGVLEGMNSLISNGALIKKVYLPTEVFPFVCVTSHLIHLLFSLPVLAAILLCSHMAISPHVALLPLLLLLQFTFSYAVALFLASLAVQFRDLVHVAPHLLMIWFYLTPIFYASDMVPPAYRVFLLLNPLGYMVGAYRDIFVTHRMPSLDLLGTYGVAAVVLLGGGLWFFKRRREMYAELV